MESIFELEEILSIYCEDVEALTHELLSFIVDMKIDYNDPQIFDGVEYKVPFPGLLVIFQHSPNFNL